MKEQLLAEFEKAKLELHQAVDALVADAPDYLKAVESVAEKHTAVQALVTVLARI